jgi:hypothetical protein
MSSDISLIFHYQDQYIRINEDNNEMGSPCHEKRNLRILYSSSTDDDDDE